MIRLFDLTIDRNLILEILYDFVDSFNSSIGTILGSFQGDLVAVHSIPWEADDDSSKLVSNFPEDVTSLGHEMFVILGIDSHGSLDNVVKLLYLSLHDLLSGVTRLLGPDDSDGLLVHVIRPGEDDSGSSLIADLLDVDPGLPDQELVMLGLGLHLGRDATQLFLLAELLQQLDGLLDVLLGSSDSHVVTPGVGLRKLDGYLRCKGDLIRFS